ncbi:TadE/TadG family type IV pilus assembly protein [Novosphingobium sp. B 225]|uniref:TadE/TadG family type IV pilus assembly protein n=1 Tax=Novosphingobium sp. B 225 TaxID=1961849 RepID=UPI000B4B82E6|nr:TadE/TadG family type IV pilus assembly protein [Novosphingobium sp. B 225]
MSKLSRLLLALRQDRSGSVAIEFGLIGPLFLAMFLGVLQIGIAMQNQNALRSISADVARHAAVMYQQGTKPDDDSIETYAYQIAEAPPYGLRSTGLTITADTSDSPQFTGAKEISLTIEYAVPSFLEFIGVGELPLTYKRPIFVMP